MADLVCSLPQRLVGLIPLLHTKSRAKTVGTNIHGVFLFIYPGLTFLIRVYLSRSVGCCCVGLPAVSRREPPCRCGGRRGGLNDSQHCAVGPGLQSPQRWSFPPASISLSPSPSTLNNAQLRSFLSIQPFRSTEASIFFFPFRSF